MQVSKIEPWRDELSQEISNPAKEIFVTTAKFLQRAQWHFTGFAQKNLTSFESQYVIQYNNQRTKDFNN